MLLQELLARGLSEEAFFAEYTTPALLIEALDVTAPKREAPESIIPDSTEVLSPAVIQQELSRGATFLGSQTQIEWLAKSDRNPFANLITIGRARTNDIILDHTVVSKVHATFSQLDGQWYVQDGKSRNGTFVNGVRLQAGKKTAINDGDGIDLGGEVSTRFMTPEALWAFIRQVAR